MIEYIIESTICFALLYLSYVAFCNNSRQYKINRIILMCIILFSTTVPLLNLSFPSSLPNVITNTEISPKDLTVSSYLTDTSFIAQSTSNSSEGYSTWVIAIYLSISLILLIRFVINFSVIILKSRQSKKIKSHGSELTLVEGNGNPFTFFNTIFISRNQFEQGNVEAELIAHEKAHQQQLHSMDIVIIELIQVGFWFNPFVYLFKRLIKANHEYLADEFVLNSGACPSKYGNKLLQHSFQKNIVGLTSGFNHLLIKNRLIMLSKHDTSKQRAFQMLVLIPIIAILFFSTAFTNASGNGTDQDLEAFSKKAGTFYADTLFWSGENQELYMIGKVRIKHQDNDFSGDGRFSVIGKVHVLIIDGKRATLNSSIVLTGIKCQILEIPEEEAFKKYGAEGKLGTVEIKTLR